MSDNDRYLGRLEAGLEGIKEQVKIHTDNTKELLAAYGKTVDLLSRTSTDNSGAIKLLITRMDDHEEQDAAIRADLKTLRKWVIVAGVAGLMLFVLFAPEALPKAVRFIASLL